MRQFLRRRKALQLHRTLTWPHGFVRISDYRGGTFRYIEGGFNDPPSAYDPTLKLIPMEIGRIDRFRILVSPALPERKLRHDRRP